MASMGEIKMIRYTICMFHYNQSSTNKNTMQLQESEKIVAFIIQHLDQKVWSNIAVKAIQKIAPLKLTKESNKMFSDFTVLNSGIDKKSGISIVEQVDNANKITENYIVGTSKMIQRSYRSKSEYKSQQMPKAPLASRVAIKKVKIVTNNDDKAVKQPKKNNFFELNHQEKRNLQHEKFEQSIRINRQTDLKYAKNLENAYRYSLAEKQQKIAMEKKKFKEMKAFTYDFEGRLVSTGQQKKDGKLNVLKVNSQMGPQMVTTLKKNKKFPQTKIKDIVNKKVIQYQKVFISDYMKEQKEKQVQKEAKQKQIKKSAFEKGIPPIDVMDIFQKENSVSAGVQITELTSKSKVSGRTRDKDNIKNLNLLEFRDQSKPIELFPEKKLKQASKTTSYFRTEGNEPLHQRQRVKTEANDSHNYTSASKFSRFRGIIRITNQKLYSQNFYQSTQQY